MPFLDVYLCHGDEASKDGSVPFGTIFNSFPHGPRRRVWYDVMARTDDGRFKEWVDVDWGTRVAKVTKAQIIQFIREVYAEVLAAPESYASGMCTIDHVRTLLEDAEKLSDDGVYSLVARES